MIDFIQVGANAGLTEQGEDIIWPIVRKNEWKGIFVEPLPHIFDKLVKNYEDLVGSFFEKIAIMDYDGDVVIHYAPGDGDSRLASSRGSHARSRNKATVSVPCMTIESLVTKYHMLDVPFELLQIDIEGADGDILKCTDFTHILPKYIRFENCHLGRNGNISKGVVINHLITFGYEEVPDIFDHKAPGVKEQGIDTLMERK